MADMPDFERRVLLRVSKTLRARSQQFADQNTEGFGRIMEGAVSIALLAVAVAITEAIRSEAASVGGGE